MFTRQVIGSNFRDKLETDNRILETDPKMKLRIKGNSIRLRLLRSEVERLAAELCISEATAFGPNALRYSISISNDAESLHASFENNEIVVAIPKSLAQRWADSDQVGLDAEQPLGNGGTLSIVIEKDFVCVDRTDDPDRADAYPNPRLECDTPG